jgi:hypothetical protein
MVFGSILDPLPLAILQQVKTARQNESLVPDTQCSQRPDGTPSFLDTPFRLQTAQVTAAATLNQQHPEPALLFTASPRRHCQSLSGAGERRLNWLWSSPLGSRIALSSQKI